MVGERAVAILLADDPRVLRRGLGLDPKGSRGVSEALEDPHADHASLPERVHVHESASERCLAKAAPTAGRELDKHIVAGIDDILDRVVHVREQLEEPSPKALYPLVSMKDTLDLRKPLRLR